VEKNKKFINNNVVSENRSIDNLSSDLKQYSNKIKHLEETIKESEVTRQKELRDAHKKYVDGQKELKEAKKRINDNEKAITDYLNSVSKLESDLILIKTRNEVLGEENTSLLNELSTKDSQLSELQNKLQFEVLKYTS